MRPPPVPARRAPAPVISAGAGGGGGGGMPSPAPSPAAAGPNPFATESNPFADEPAAVDWDISRAFGGCARWCVCAGDVVLLRVQPKTPHDSMRSSTLWALRAVSRRTLALSPRSGSPPSCDLRRQSRRGAVQGPFSGVEARQRGGPRAGNVAELASMAVCAVPRCCAFCGTCRT